MGRLDVVDDELGGTTLPPPGRQGLESMAQLIDLQADQHRHISSIAADRTELGLEHRPQLVIAAAETGPGVGMAGREASPRRCLAAEDDARRR